MLTFYPSRITDPGVKKGTGSRIRIRNTAEKAHVYGQKPRIKLPIKNSISGCFWKISKKYRTKCLIFYASIFSFILCFRNAFSPPTVLALCKGTIYSNASPKVESLPSCSRIVQISFFAVYILRLILLGYNDAFTPVCVAERGARNNQDLYLLCAPTEENIYLVDDNPKIPGSWVWICGILMLVWSPPPLAFFMGCDVAQCAGSYVDFVSESYRWYM